MTRFFVIFSLVAWGPAAARPIELPATRAVDVDAVVLELWDVDVDVVVDPSSEPLVRALPVDGGPRQADLEVSSTGRTLTVTRPAVDAGQGLRFRLELTVGPKQLVTVGGRDLAVTVRDARSPEELEADDEELEDEADEDGEDEDEADEDGENEAAEDEADELPHAEAPSPSDPAAIRLVLADSHLELTEVRNVAVDAHRTSVWLTRTQGTFRLDLEYAEAQVRRHQGDLRLESTESEVTVHDLRGSLEPRMTGGSLDVRQGTGTLRGTFTDAVLLADGWQGYVELRGIGATVEARGTERPMPWSFEGEDLLVTLDEIAGPVTARLHGGRLQAGAMSGRLAVTAAGGADVELEGLAQNADLKVSGGSSLRVDGASAPVHTEVYDSELRAERVAQLFVNAERSRITAGEVRRLAGLVASDSDVVLDLTSSLADAFLKLVGSSRAVVRLGAPCSVRLAGPGGSDAAAADVLGCDLRLGGQPGPPVRGRTVFGDRRPVTLTVSLADGVELEVEGLP